MGDPTAMQRLAKSVGAEAGKAVVGQETAIESLLIGLITGGHVLLEGVPGTAKTLMARSLAFCLDATFKRIQFSPDLMPADVVGTTVYDAASGTFHLRKGPVFANLVLADEINRTPPKTQAALLEAMQEGQVTIDGAAHALPQPFLVVATQNPIEYEGTYPLPEAQLDRFQQKVVIDYPDEASEIRVLERHVSGLEMTDMVGFGMQPVATLADVMAARETLADVVVDEGLVRYTAQIVRSTREHPSVLLGASPRAGVSLLVASKAHAMLAGRDYVTPDDVKSMSPRCLRHRIIVRPEVEIEGFGADAILADVLDKVPVPR
jgi:MoxR-like ATPase